MAWKVSTFWGKKKHHKTSTETKFAVRKFCCPGKKILFCTKWNFIFHQIFGRIPEKKPWATQFLGPPKTSAVYLLESMMDSERNPLWFFRGPQILFQEANFVQPCGSHEQWEKRGLLNGCFSGMCGDWNTIPVTKRDWNTRQVIDLFNLDPY